MAKQEYPGKEKQPEEDKEGGKKPKLHSNTPENAVGQINPASPGDTGTTPGTVADVG